MFLVRSPLWWIPSLSDGAVNVVANMAVDKTQDMVIVDIVAVGMDIKTLILIKSNLIPKLHQIINPTWPTLPTTDPCLITKPKILHGPLIINLINNAKFVESGVTLMKLIALDNSSLEIANTKLYLTLNPSIPPSLSWIYDQTMTHFQVLLNGYLTLVLPHIWLRIQKASHQ